MTTELLEEPAAGTSVQRPYNLILLNDDFHSVDYVVRMCSAVFGFDVDRGVMVAMEVHFTGRCLLFSGSLEVAELKQEQVHSFGPDPLVAGCKGSMTAVIEKA